MSDSDLALASVAVAKRRENVASLLARGYTPMEIAKRTNAIPQAVYEDIKVIQQNWRVSAQGRAHYTAYIGRHLAALDEIERESWHAWEASLRPKEETVSEQVNEGASGEGENEGGKVKTRAVIKRKEQGGDSRLLRVILETMNQRADLLGLNAIRPSASIDLSKLTGEQLERIASGENPYKVIGDDEITVDADALIAETSWRELE